MGPPLQCGMAPSLHCMKPGPGIPTSSLPCRLRCHPSLAATQPLPASRSLKNFCLQPPSCHLTTGLPPHMAVSCQPCPMCCFPASVPFPSTHCNSCWSLTQSFHPKVIQQVLQFHSIPLLYIDLPCIKTAHSGACVLPQKINRSFGAASQTQCALNVAASAAASPEACALPSQGQHLMPCSHSAGQDCGAGHVSAIDDQEWRLRQPCQAPAAALMEPLQTSRTAANRQP